MAGKVAIIMGSKSDMSVAEKAESTLREFEIGFETLVISAHRNPNKIRRFALTAEQKGFAVIIALAGLAAHLPGVLASMTTLPVIGVPVEAGPLGGRDALYSIVQMPPGIPVACVGINNSRNAAILAAQILSTGDSSLRSKIKESRKQFGDDEN